MSTLSASVRARNAVAIVGLFAVVIAPVTYFVAFLFAYGLRETITPGEHVYFLIEIAAIAVFIAIVATPFVRASAAIPASQAFWLALWVSLAINLTVVGMGSIVSARFADQNSVTAEYSWPIDIVLAAGLFGAATVAAWIASRSRPR